MCKRLILLLLSLAYVFNSYQQANAVTPAQQHSISENTVAHEYATKKWDSISSAVFCASASTGFAVGMLRLLSIKINDKNLRYRHLSMIPGLLVLGTIAGYSIKNLYNIYKRYKNEQQVIPTNNNRSGCRIICEQALFAAFISTASFVVFKP